MPFARTVHATIHDVARDAGVSVASVSRVLNRHDNVRPEMRARVEEAAARLGYVPHAGARSLSLARTGAIGVVLPDLHGEFFSELLRGMDREASARGLGLLLTMLHDGRGLDTLANLRGQVDGLVVMAPHLRADVLAQHMPRGLAALFLNCAPDDAAATLRIDNRTGAAAMVAHLVERGARRIVHVSGPAGNVDADERRAGAEQAAAAAGVALHVEGGDFRERSGAIVAECVAAGTLEADAIFAANDMMAIGALMALRRAGVDVPGQVLVAGFDDIPLARLVSPALTTMRIDIAALGARAVARLAARIAGTRAAFVQEGSGEQDSDDGTGTEEVVPHLVARATTTTETIWGNDR
ncbi:LacI family DNA-binding transcriptional regulator [Sphingomonas phyllosphaerae]|uniref:LacI family DNA-binding transcriptional regulator n=1 Tax=Sphingomonas phyllosphaerae TaxID=257003 RepID=UPI0003B71315|nr:LacI family DNA-binding transcriptional regulator [Sphingomonas phyllosphaerae]